MELSDSECREISNVIVLTHLTEDVIVRVLKLRYEELIIYTNAGSVLMAVNPFTQVPLYTHHYMNIYRKAFLGTLEKLPPHPWKTTAKSYIQMFGDDRQTCSLLKETKSSMVSQSIIVSGESGAGKTETTKIIMAYLARISSLNRGKDSMGTIQANVLEANTILDAVGNARTIRNDNSSRFGKYIKLHFDKTGELVGASLDTFLLETTRVVRRNEDEERNFHIFYLICSESDKSEREALKINSASSYAYLNSSGIYDRRDGVKDSDMLQQFKKSMNMLGIDPECMQSLLKCFVVILTVGNIKFSSHTNDAGTVEIKIQESTKKYLADAAVLLGIPALDLLRSFTTRNMVVAGERVDVTLTSSQAEDMRDVFAKSLYNVIFAWIIEFLNVQLSFDDHSFESFSLSSQGLPKLSKRASSKYILAGIDQFGARIRTDSDSSTFSSVIQSSAPGMIGILDIFGFEKQPHNGLEQLLINYANECLQKQYDEVMIDAEQAYYATEGISWDLIEFPSNKDCIELISSKMTSVLTLLDEACLAPSGSDTSFIRQVYKNLSKQSRMHLTARIQGRNEFGIKHYAGNVVYSVEGFVKKNKNEIFPLALLKVSKNDFVARIGRSADAEENNTNGKTEGNLSPKKSKRFLVSSISNSFKNNVSQLIATLNETQTAYVKCIKPNSLNVKSNFMNQFVCEQLRCNGIMQTIVVTRCGFPIRYTYDDFDDRYYSLLRALVVGKEYSITVGIDAVIARLRKALSSGEIRISENTTTLNSLSSLQQSSKSADSTCYNSAEMSGWGIQRGHTRVFLRYNEYHALNCLHNNMVGIMATQIQKVYRGYVCFSLFQKKKQASTKIKRSYIRFHRELMLMTSVLIIQDFFRIVVASVVNEKKEAGRIVAAFAYKYLHVRTKAEAMRKRHLIVKIQRWWRRFPWYISPDQRVLLNALFSPIISPLQIAAREKIAAVKRKSNVKGRRFSNGKETPSKRFSFSCKKSREENPVWHSGSPNVSGSFDSSNNGHQVQQPITCRDLLKANSQILWTIFSFYSKEKANVPGNSVSSSKRNSMGLVTAAGMINLLRDWSLIPSLCSQYKANKLLKEQFFKDKPSRNLISFSQFLSFVNKLASSFYKDNDTRELTDKIRFLDSKFHWSDEVIALKHLLSVMNASDGRNRFSQARNAGLIPSFLGVYGSEEALLVYLESQTGTLNHIEANNIHIGPTSRKDLTPSFREVEMCDAVHQLMRKNESTLISLALRYTLSKSSVTASPGNKKESRKSSVILPFEAVFNCLHDFDVCPTLCSKSVLRTLYRLVENSSKALHYKKGLNYPDFIELLDHVAQNCDFGTKRYNSSESRVRAMFHHMNSSRGRSILNRDPNSLIINPLTGLESTDPKLESSSAHRKNVVSKVSAMMSTTPEKDRNGINELSPSRRKLPMSHYQHLRTIKTPPRPTVPESNHYDERPEWNFR